MACILRVHSRDFDVNAYLTRAPLHAYDWWRVGGTRTFGTQAQPTAGFLVRVSGAEFSQPWTQVSDAVRFLTKHRTNLAELAQLLRELDPDTVDTRMELDFGIEDRSGTLSPDGQQVVAQVDHFPAELLRLAGTLGIGLTVSRYPQRAAEVG